MHGILVTSFHHGSFTWARNAIVPTLHILRSTWAHLDPTHLGAKFKDLRVRLLELLAILLHSCDQVMDHPNIRDPPRHPNKVTRHLRHLVPLAYPASRTGRSVTNLVPLRSIAVSLRNMEPTYLAVPLGMKQVFGLLNGITWKLLSNI